MTYQYNNQISEPIVGTRVLIPVFALIFTVFIAWCVFQQSALLEKKLYHRVLATVAPTGINANGIEMDGRNVIIGLGYIQSDSQLQQINQLLVNLAGVAHVYNKNSSPMVIPALPPTPTPAPVVTAPMPASVDAKAVQTVVVEPVANLSQLLHDKMGQLKLEFGFRTPELEPKSQTILTDLVPLFLHYPQQSIRIAGHTDNQGEPKLNLHLSQKRAEAVMHFLIKKGVNKQQLSAVGYGETQPIASNDTPAGRSQNNRITFNAGE